MSDNEILAKLQETKDVPLAIQEYRNEHKVSETYAKATLREIIEKSRKFKHYEKICLLRDESLQTPPKPKPTTDWKDVVVQIIGILILFAPFVLLFSEFEIWEGIAILIGTYMFFEFFMGR